MISDIFDITTDNNGLHLKNSYKDGEVDEKATTEQSSVVQRMSFKLLPISYAYVSTSKSQNSQLMSP